MAEITPDEALQKLIIPPEDELHVVVVTRAPGLTKEQQGQMAAGFVATIAQMGLWAGYGQVEFITQTEFLPDDEGGAD